MQAVSASVDAIVWKNHKKRDFDAEDWQ